jgi:hypothetical protein
MEPNDFATWVHAMKAEQRWSKAEIGRRLGTSPNMVRRWMTRPSPRYIGLAVTAIMLNLEPWPVPIKAAAA